MVAAPLSFLIFLVSAFAETNRLPFDLPESEQELIGGFHTEYSAMKFGMFFLGEYLHVITVSFLTVIVFFFMDLTGKSKSKHMGPISDLVPRFMDGHLKAHDWGTPDAYDRAKRILDANIAEARRMKKEATRRGPG